jgi:colanic acid/amylovoran biosynthesis glycosyltransferase
VASTPLRADTGRRPVAVLLSRFPLVTETFILREVIEMERQGRPVRLVPIVREHPQVVHREALPWMRRLLDARLLSPAVLGALFRALRRRPGQVLKLLARLAAASAGSPNFLVRTLALFPKAVWAAERLAAEEVGHLHAHFATHPATLALVVSELTGIPWSFTVHAHDLFVRREMLGEKLAAARSVRAISRFNRELLERWYPAEAAGKVEVIHVGIDPDLYRRLPPPPAPSVGLPELLCIASFRPYKGLPVLLDACRRLADAGVGFRCQIVGDGPMRPELERRVAELGLAGIVRLAGALPQDEVARRLGASTAFVLPSVVAPDGQMEGIPVALMEAMAAGRPVVASALSGVPELVEHGVSGLLVPPGDAPALAAALQRLLADPELARGLGERGRQAVERGFRLDATVAALLERVDRHALPAGPEVAALLARVGLEGAGVRRVHRRRDSRVVEALAPGPREVVVKVQRSRPGESRPPIERARHEFTVLSSLDHAFRQEPGFGVPRPLGFVEEEAAVLLARCQGEALDEIVRRGRATRGPGWAALLAALRRVGRWLRLFQRHTHIEQDAGRALEALLARAVEDLAACGRRGLVPAELARALEPRIERLARSVDTAELAGHHGDFWPGNVFVEEGEGAVQVIDFEGYRQGLPAEDAAWFLLHLQPFFAWPGLRGRCRRAAAAFLDGWADGGPLDASALELCRVAQALQLLAAEEGATAGWRERRRRRALVSILRRPGGRP